MIVIRRSTTVPAWSEGQATRSSGPTDSTQGLGEGQVARRVPGYGETTIVPPCLGTLKS